MLPKPCLVCGDLTTASHCPDHTPTRLDNRRGRDRSTVGRGGEWIRLSKRARAMQPWCSDCGGRGDDPEVRLTADHLPSAWHKILVTKRPLTLHDVEVVCDPCNSRRGPSGPGSQRYERWLNLSPTDEKSQPRGDSPLSEGVCAPGLRPLARYSSGRRTVLRGDDGAGSIPGTWGEDRDRLPFGVVEVEVTTVVDGERVCIRPILGRLSGEVDSPALGVSHGDSPIGGGPRASVTITQRVTA